MIDPAKFVARPGRRGEGASTREQILEAAAELIPAQSDAATSVAQSSRVSAANPASIDWASGSKEAKRAPLKTLANGGSMLLRTPTAHPSRGDSPAPS